MEEHVITIQEDMADTMVQTFSAVVAWVLLDVSVSTVSIFKVMNVWPHFKTLQSNQDSGILRCNEVVSHITTYIIMS